jgi:hypothetical protein
VLDPLAEFRRVFDRAAENAPYDPVAVTLATASRDGRPSARIVLLRGVDDHGFVFFAPDRHGQGLTNTYETYLGNGSVVPHSSFAYWTSTYGVEGLPSADAVTRTSPVVRAAARSRVGLAKPADLEAARCSSSRITTPTSRAGRAPPPLGRLLQPGRIEFRRAGTYRCTTACSTLHAETTGDASCCIPDP